jgi:site-specific DNA recombinase
MIKSQEKYFIYARKSSESDEKQVQSIEDQTLIMQGIARSYGLNIIETISESKTAKEPNGRPEFEKMLQRIRNGEASGILCWKIDRLSRNPIDSAQIQWMLQKETITSIRTPDRDYRPEDNALLLSVESSMANQYIRDLSKNVKRGLQSKINKGWMPCSAPLGYLNTKTEIRGENYIIKDPQRFTLIRNAWELMLSGNYSAAQILHKLNNEWGFLTRKTKKVGGRPMGKSTLYDIFTNQFYIGIIPYRGLFTQGKHDPMITIEEFDRVQFLLGRHGKPRPTRHDYAYNGKIECGECSGFISATFKEKLLKTSGLLQPYTLYYCTCARRKGEKCLQRHYTNSTLIDEEVERKLDTLTIMPEFLNWALEIIEESKSEENLDKSNIYESQMKALAEKEKHLANLTQMRLKDMIDDTEYLKEKTQLKNEIVLMQNSIKEEETNAANWITLTAKTFEFATYAHKAFITGDAEMKREILSGITNLNCALKDHLLSISTVEWLVPIQELYPAIESQYMALEPEKRLTQKGRKEAFDLLRPYLRGRADLNRRPPA